MPGSHDHLSETHILGRRTRQTIVRVDEKDGRTWLQNTPACPALAQHRIAHLGVCEAHAPYRIVRLRQSGTYFMACIGGEGRILVDGRWQVCRTGMACLLPPHLLNAFHAVPGKKWEFAWVRYQSVPEKRPIVMAGSPVLARFDGTALRLAALGLAAECESAHSTPAAIHHWVELIQGYVLQFAQPWQMDERLSRLWEKVAVNPGAPWTATRLARDANMSEEHLRRLTTTQLGRSPMRHVTWLRMRRAAELLATTDEKIESIAHAVGHQNPFVFSTTFKKWIGWRPSEHRAKAPGRAHGQ
jgi:AraC-like DNA-binding protein